jgi:cytochrome c oxidase subunit II
MKSAGNVVKTALVVVAALLYSGIQLIYADASVRVITVHARRFEFDPSEVTLKLGQPVKFIFFADDVAHGIAIDDLDLDVDMPLKKPREALVTPSEVGDFKGRCSRYCGSGHSAMSFVVHVRH